MIQRLLFWLHNAVNERRLRRARMDLVLGVPWERVQFEWLPLIRSEEDEPVDGEAEMIFTTYSSKSKDYCQVCDISKPLRSLTH